MDTIPLHDFTKDDHHSIPFQIKTLEENPKYDPQIPHRHNFYQIFYFDKGDGEIEIDYEHIQINDNSIYFISPGQVHKISPSKCATGFVIYFSREFYSLTPVAYENLLDLPFFNNNVSLPFINLSPDSSEIFQLCLSMEKEFKLKNEGSNSILWTYLHLLILRSKSYYKPNKGEKRSFYKASVLLLKFNRMIESDFKEKHSVHEYISALTVTPELLNDECKKMLGKNASELISDRIVLEAKRMLLYSELSNKEIAFYLNFNDPSYFSRFFKKKTGFSPKDFRKSLQQSIK